MQTGQSTWQDAAYTEARETLLKAEIALMEQREKVAELRRALPSTPIDTDYGFDEGPADLADASPGGQARTHLSELFGADKNTLIVVHFMYGPGDTAPCPMCTMWADGYDAIAPHVTQKANLVLVAKTDIATLRNFARGRGWTNLRLLSSRDSRFNADFGVESEDGKAQFPAVSVFTRNADGGISHFYTGTALLGPDHYRGIDLFTPVWHLFDLLPDGRGDWMPKLSYG